MKRLSKKVLWKDIKKCFAKSKGRFFSIVSLIALGSFALVGLQVAGPNMRQTGRDYFKQLNVSDISVLGDYGIDEENEKAINEVSGAKKIEYGYLKDVTVKDTTTSIRVFSTTEDLSKYELVDGSMPKGDDEIAIASFLSDEYSIGEKISFSEKKDMSGNKVLKHHTFKIVGFVNSGELLSSINMGNSTAGTGELKGYAAVAPEAFDSDVYMIARLSFEDTQGVDPYSDEYTDLIQAHKDELNELLKEQPSLRLAAIKEQYDDEIKDGQKDVDDAKQKLKDAKKELDDGKQQLEDASQQIEDSEKQLEEGIAQAQTQISEAQAQIDAAEDEISDNESTLQTAEATLSVGQSQIDRAKEQLQSKQSDLQTAKMTLAQDQAQLSQKNAQLQQKQQQYNAQKAAGMSSSDLVQLDEEIIRLQSDVKSLNSTIQTLQTKILSGESQLASAQQTLSEKEALLSEKQQEYDSGAAKLDSAKEQIAEKKEELSAAKQEVQTQKTEGEQKIKEAKKELEQKQEEYEQAKAKYEKEKPKAEEKIKDAEAKLEDAKETRDSLEAPVYALDTRREIPGAEGYKIYGSVSNIIDALADVFPIFLYFVAALVTLTTMTRFVDEERINSGTLKALGYSNRDIMKKFVVYGWASSSIGALIGIVAGHILIPLIVYNAYGKSFTYPTIELHFYPEITLIAIVLAFVSAVIPAYFVSTKELREKPAALLQPKPPAAGSKIFLERIKPIWSKMSFTHKVTARNIFRYKKRMLMTIFGVSGAVALLFTGLSVQHSISGINDRQFGEIIQYDLIVAKENNLSTKQEKKLNKLLESDAVEKQTAVIYEEMTKVAGDNQDKQSINLIVPKEEADFQTYVSLKNRKTKETLSLEEDGVILSERLADLLDASVGDTIAFTDSDNVERDMKVSAITEMYTGHFMFCNRDYYEQVFGTDYKSNANLVTLKDRSIENANKEASKYIKLDSVEGVVQNTTLINQINTIVKSLNKIMSVLIVVSILLAIVILYNLTNINVAERIRELSTIKVLGFYDEEVTMYIYRETILLTLLGILVGFALGDALFLYILKVVPPDEVMFNPALGLRAFLIPFVVVGTITVVLGHIINKNLQNVDMLEALKSVE